ncbi:MAG: DUF3352 domain-containing protein, partial [Acaryochloridaceae cyanobacterium SU_2_1]|nr:DUF3352 domain-containing protein [Acaryochloridaceae cyanobacterium SU_2_1]
MVGWLKPITYLASATLEDRYLLLANQEQVLYAALDTLDDPELKLTSSADYQAAIAPLSQTSPTGIAYLDLAALLPKLLGQSSSSTPPTYHSLGLALRNERQGLLVDTLLVADADRSMAAPQARPQPLPTALDYFPGNSP